MRVLKRIFVEGEPLTYPEAAAKIGAKVPSLRYAVNKCPNGWRYKGFWVSKFPGDPGVKRKPKPKEIEAPKPVLSEADEFFALTRDVRAKVLDSLHVLDQYVADAYAMLKERERQKGGHVFTDRFSTAGERVG